MMGNLMIRPKVVMCNIFSEIHELKTFVSDHAFSGIDWSFELGSIPATPAEETKWVQNISILAPLELRYHCPFYKTDLGHQDQDKAKEAGILFERIIRLVSKAGGKVLSIHIGLGRNSTEPLSWDGTIDKLRSLVQYGANYGVKVCLENLAWGWTSKPNLFEKLIRRSGAWVTFDTGHARVCESIHSQQYSMEDFVTPHSDRVLNAHIYQEEIPGVGHVPPENLPDIEKPLSLLHKIGCPWWVIEIKEPEGLLKTKRIIEEWLKAQGTGHEPNDSH